MDSTWNAARIAKTAAAIFALGFVALVAGFSVALHRNPWQILTGQFTPSPQELFQKDNALVLLEGLDYDYTDKDQEFSTHSRSDVIKAINFDFRTHKIYVLAIPRDMEATLPNGETAKINQAQSDGGVREAQAVIAKWLGSPPFDRYVLLRINTTKDLINAIGGIDLYVKDADCLRSHTDCAGGRLDYDDSWGHLHIHFKEGLQHLDGDQAVAYGRFRHDWCSDPCRIMRQSQVMQAALEKMKGDKFNTLLHMNDLIGVFRRDVDTNLTQQELISLATSFADMPKNGLVTEQVPYLADRDDGGIAGNVLVPDTGARAKLVNDMLVNPPAPSPPPDTRVAAVDPKNVRVDVQNGSGIAGAARRVAAILRKQGFVIAKVGNAPRSDFSATEVHEHSKIANAGARVRDALGKNASAAAVVSDAAPAASDVTVIVGQDIAAKLALQTETP